MKKATERVWKKEAFKLEEEKRKIKRIIKKKEQYGGENGRKDGKIIS